MEDLVAQRTISRKWMPLPTPITSRTGTTPASMIQQTVLCLWALVTPKSTVHLLLDRVTGSGKPHRAKLWLWEQQRRDQHSGSSQTVARSTNYLFRPIRWNLGSGITSRMPLRNLGLGTALKSCQTRQGSCTNGTSVVINHWIQGGRRISGPNVEFRWIKWLLKTRWGTANTTDCVYLFIRCVEWSIHTFFNEMQKLTTTSLLFF